MESRLPESPAAKPPAEVTYRVIVASPDEAVRALREKFGDGVEVVSVRAVSAPGLKGFFGSRRFEVLARPARKDPVREQPVPPTEEETEALEPPLRGRGLATPSFADVLKRAGFSERVLDVLREDVVTRGAREQTTHRSLVAFGDALLNRFADRQPRPLPARAAFIGSAGAGRTTALCKWLGCSVFQLGRQGRVFRLELDQPNRAEGLDLLAEALGFVLEHLGQKGFAGAPVSSDFEYIHCPALSISRPDENAALKRFLDEQAIDGRVLVLNAAYDPVVQRAIVRAGRELGATHLVFTHLDEISSWGRLWDPLIESDLTPLFLSMGPSLTGGLEPGVVRHLIQKTLPGF